jgi:hypothetical protein
MFNDLLSSRWPNQMIMPSLDPKTINIYPISEYNLEGIKILYDNSIRMGHDNINVEMASISPTLWMGDLLDKHWTKISFVCSTPVFEVMKIEGGNFVSKNYTTEPFECNTEDELDEFFTKGKYKKLVIFSISKNANLSTMNTYYKIRYADITEKFEERDSKLTEILK